MKDKLFWWGFVIISIGYFATLNPVWIIFGTPLIYLAGCIIVSLSKKKLAIKVIVIVSPIILWLPGFFALSYFGTHHLPPETFLIPETFQGKIIIYYNEPCGQEQPKTDSGYIYNIPANGIVILKRPIETGIIDQRYFIVDSKGRKEKELSMFIQQDFNEDYTIDRNKNEPPRNKLAVFLGGTGNGIGVDSKRFYFTELYVDSWDSLRVYNNNKSDTTALNVLRSCRLKNTNGIWTCTP
jgi:hypothetical protein